MTAVDTHNDEHIARMLQDQERNEVWQRHQLAHASIQQPAGRGQQQPQQSPPPAAQPREPSPPQPANPIDQGLQRAPPSNPIAAELRPDDLPPGAPAANTGLDLDGGQAVQSPNELPEYQGAPPEQQRPAVVPPSSHAAGGGAGGGGAAMTDEQLALALQDEEIRTSRQQYREQQRREIAHERPAENKKSGCGDGGCVMM